jgi:ribosomal subunit interface protein
MRIHVTARHCELDPEDRLLAEQRIEKLSRFVRDIQEAHVTVSQEKHRYLVEISLRVRGREMTSHEEADAARTAIERAADRLEQQVRRLKERRLERRRGDRTRAADGLVPPEPATESDDWSQRAEAAGDEE